MERFTKPYVQLPIDAVDAVVLDPEGRYDPEHYDRYATFTEARDAALSSVELILDVGDYDGDDHREELSRMLGLLEGSESYEQLTQAAGYQWFLDRLSQARPTAA